MLHLYKSRLQHYAQKQNLTLPVYSSELDGPPHSRRFRSKVTVDGVTYETPEFFSTLKEAEHAAAKVAFESLTLNDIQEVSRPIVPVNFLDVPECLIHPISIQRPNFKTQIFSTTHFLNFDVVFSLSN